MPKRTDIKKVMVIGSGPIVIGQAAEFDYAGTQACLALKEEGYEVILVNSNPATIMTDTHIADKVYMEPLTLEYVAKIIRYERPDAIVPGHGRPDGPESGRAAGQKGRVAGVPGRDSGYVVREHRAAPKTASCSRNCASGWANRCCRRISPTTWRRASPPRERIGYPVVLRPAFTLGGTGGGFADNREELEELMRKTR